jgi:hypothetical protein
MASIVSAGTTSATALNMSADTSGVLQLASNNGTVALTIDASQRINIGTTSSITGYALNVNGQGAFSGPSSDADGNAGVRINYGNASGTVLRFLSLNANGSTNAAIGLNMIDSSNGGMVFSVRNSNSLNESMRITSVGSVQSTNGLGASSAKSQNTLYPTVMIGGSSGTTSCTNTISYYQAGAGWEPMVYFVTVSACKGDLSAIANANYVIRMTHYNGGTANTISTSGGNTGEFTLSYSNTGSTSGTINTSAITATVSASYDHIVMSIQAASWAGISSIT